MSTEHNTSGMFTVFFSLEFKFVNSFQYNSEYCNSYVKTSAYVINRYTIDHWDIISQEI